MSPDCTSAPRWLCVRLPGGVDDIELQRRGVGQHAATVDPSALGVQNAPYGGMFNDQVGIHLGESGQRLKVGRRFGHLVPNQVNVFERRFVAHGQVNVAQNEWFIPSITPVCEPPKAGLLPGAPPLTDTLAKLSLLMEPNCAYKVVRLDIL